MKTCLSLRDRVLEVLLSEHVSALQLARILGCSKPTAYFWLDEVYRSDPHARFDYARIERYGHMSLVYWLES